MENQEDPYVWRWNRNRVDWLYEIARCGEVDPAAVRLGLLFATFLQPDIREEVRPKYEWLCENAHMSRATVSRGLRQLREAGFLYIRTHRGEGSWYSMPFTGDEVWSRSREQ